MMHVMTRRGSSAREALAALVDLLRRSAAAFTEARARRLSAGLAYYAVFALIPAIATSVAIAAVLVGREAAEGTISNSLTDALGRSLALDVEEAIAAAWESANTSQFTLLSLLVVTYTASLLFVAWRDTLELIWDVPYVFDVRTSIVGRIVAMLVPVLVGFILAGTIVAQTVVALVTEFSRFGLIDVTLQVAGTVMPSVVAVATLAALYRYSTRAAKPPWAQVLRGAGVAWIGLALLTWGFGVYLRVVGTTSLAGAASSVYVGLILLYYGAQVMLFGANVVRCSAEAKGAAPWGSSDRRTASDVSRNTDSTRGPDSTDHEDR